MLNEECYRISLEVARTGPGSEQLQLINQEVFQMVFDLGRAHLTTVCSSLRRFNISDPLKFANKSQSLRQIAREIIFALPGVVGLWVARSCNNPHHYLGRVDWVSLSHRQAGLEAIQKLKVADRLAAYGIQTACPQIDL